MDADVVVVGCGAMGSMATWQLAKRGVSVVGVEQYYVGHDRGAAGGDIRIFRTVYGESPEYVPMLVRAQELWRDLEAESGLELLHLTGGLMIGPAGSEFIGNLRACIDRYGLPYENISLAEAEERYPQHVYLDHDEVIYDPNAGYVYAEKSIRAAIAVARDLGADVREGTKVTGIEPHSEGVEVRTTSGTVRAKCAIVTTGPWVLELVPQYAAVMNPHRLIQPWFLPRDPAMFTPERFPIYLRKEDDADIAGFPSIDGLMVKTGQNDVHESDWLADPADLPRTVPLDQLEPVTTAITRYINGLDDPPARVVNYMDAYSSDLHAAIGFTSTGRRNVLAASGFSGHGFKMSPAIGELLASVVLDGADVPSHLSQERFDQA